jgi:hypothetical protein
MVPDSGPQTETTVRPAVALSIGKEVDGVLAAWREDSFVAKADRGLVAAEFRPDSLASQPRIRA